MNGQIGFGVIVAFMIYVRQFTNPLSQLAQSVTSLQSTAAASERVFEFLETEELPDESGMIRTMDDLFGMVLQDTWLFEGTVRENLCYGKKHISNEQLDAACRAVALYHFIETLPHGYDTVYSKLWGSQFEVA